MSLDEKNLLPEEETELLPERIPVRRRARKGRSVRGIKKKTKLRTALGIVGRVFAVIGVFLLAAIGLTVGAVTIICRGPSPAAAEVFVNTVMESSAAKFIAHMYFSEEEVAECTAAAYSLERFRHEDIAPLKALDEQAHILELWHGPTCAFKDMALQILPHLMRVSAGKTVDG